MRINLAATLALSIGILAGCGGSGDAVTGLVNPEGGTATLVVNRAGLGGVTADSGALACPQDCDEVYPAGTKVTLTAQAEAGYSFTGWSGSGVTCGSSASCELTLSESLTVTATFSQDAATQRELNVVVNGAGAVNSVPAGIACPSTACNASYQDGTAVTLTATAASGNQFSGWSGGGCSGSAASCVVNMNAARGVTATFAPITHVLTVAITGSGSVGSNPTGINCGSSCTAAFAQGTSVNLAASPADGYQFAGWTGGVCSGTGTCTVVMSAARTVGASFTPVAANTVALNVVLNGSGSVTSTPAGINCGTTCSAAFASGTSVSLSAVPATGYTFTGWAGGGCTGTGGCVVAMTAATSVAATFTQIKYTLSVSKTGSGTVTSDVGGINCGATCSASLSTDTAVTLTATPATGYAFTGWSGACTGTGTCTTTMNAARSVMATFTQVTYSMGVTVVGSGSVSSSPSGITCGASCSASFPSGTSVTLTATPATGYAFSGWSGSCTGTGTCVTSMSGAKAVTATFSTQLTYVLSASVIGSGSIMSAPAGINCGATCSATYASGTSVTLTAVPATGFAFDGWSGACTGAGACVTTVTAAQTVTGTFKASSVAVAGVVNPVLFVTQVPLSVDFATRTATFGNQQARPNQVPRGGDLYIRYPDGSLRNLTKEAGFGMEGLQGANAIAVRDPAVHWNGVKALFSMVVGAPSQQYQVGTYNWQIYEVTGLNKGEAASIKKLANQPVGYNNIAPFYGTDDRVLFTSDRPRGGESHLYPQLDEYESTPTVTGIWSLNPASGDLRLLNHAISGVFSPSIDSFGRVIFTRWDHLQQDQQADSDRASGGANFGSVTFASESSDAARLGLTPETFPESLTGGTGPYGRVAAYQNNLFSPWQVNEDGTDEETLNHIGRQELSFGFVGKSFLDDPALTDTVDSSLRANAKYIRADAGIFHMREDPSQPGVYFGVFAREFGTLTSNQIVKFNGAPSVNPDKMAVVDVTPSEDGNGALAGGRYRNPLPMSNGTLVATHTPTAAGVAIEIKEFLIKRLTANASGIYQAAESLTGGIQKSVSWWDPDARQTFSGKLWELEPVEVVARTRPAQRTAPALEAPEKSILTEEQVDEVQFRAWLKTNDLALIVTRNQTSRDRADRQQPYNLQVPGGVKTVAASGGKVYDISHFQLLQADQVRGYSLFGGRRSLATPLHDPKAKNPANAGGPVGSVRIAADGSTAAFVPARRAMTWQTTDAAGNAVVRERVWVTMQPGEVRVCASCHGVNSKDQAGGTAPVNKPEALRTLLQYWKTLPK